MKRGLALQGAASPTKMVTQRLSAFFLSVCPPKVPPSLCSSRYTSRRRAEVLYSARNPEERKQYYDTLNSQIQSRSEEMQRNKRNEEEEQVRRGRGGEKRS